MEALLLSEVWLLSEAQMRRIKPHFPLSQGTPRVDDRRIVSGTVVLSRKGLRWRNAPQPMVLTRRSTTASSAGHPSGEPRGRTGFQAPMAGV
jgi:transposase